MAFEERDQSGSLFKNDRKERETQPDYTGKAVVNGTPVYVSAWLKESANGKKFMSLGFKNREEGAFEPKSSNGDSAPVSASADKLDDTPF